MTGWRRFSHRVAGLINSRALLSLTFIIFAFGAILLCLSFLLGIDSVHDSVSDREAGFAHSPNWTGNLLLFLPLIAASLAWLVHAAKHLLFGLYEHSMFMDTQRGTPTKRFEQVEESWRRLFRLCAPFFAIYVVVITLMTTYSCWQESYRPLYLLGSHEELVRFNEQHPDLAVNPNWSNAALASPPETISRGVNLAFCIMAWTAQGLGGVVYGLLVLLTVTLMFWLLKHGLGFSKMQLVPDLRDADPRCGFQRMELPAGILFAGATLFIPAFWLVIVQNIYNTGTTGAQSVWSLTFRYGDKSWRALFDTGAGIDADIYWARLAGLFVIVLVGVVGIAIVVPAVMRNARRYCLQQREKLSPEQFEAQFGVPADVAYTRLMAMPVWPYRFVSFWEFAFLATVGILCFWWFRIAPFAVVVLIAILTLRARQLLRADAAEPRDSGPMFLKYAGVAILTGAVITGVLAWRAPDESEESRRIASARSRKSESYEPGYGNSYALLIGIGYEGNPHFDELPNAERDIATVKNALLRSSARWSIKTLTGKDATRRGIMDAFGELVEAKQRNDRLLVYYAGHGTSSGDTAAWIIPANAEPRSQDKRGATWLPFRELELLFPDTSAKHILVALDCCYSGRITRRVTDATPIAPDKYTTGKSWVVISAGKENEEVADGPPGANSPFAKAFADTLNNPPAILTASKLFVCIQSALESHAGQTPQFDALKRDGEFLFTGTLEPGPEQRDR